MRMLRIGWLKTWNLNGKFDTFDVHIFGKSYFGYFQYIKKKKFVMGNPYYL